MEECEACCQILGDSQDAIVWSRTFTQQTVRINTSVSSNEDRKHQYLQPFGSMGLDQ